MKRQPEKGPTGLHTAHFAGSVSTGSRESASRLMSLFLFLNLDAANVAMTTSTTLLYSARSNKYLGSLGVMNHEALPIR